MAFTYNCLTFAGAGLLAQADSSNPIVYIGAVGSTGDYIDSQLLTMDSPSDARWDIQGGVIVAASATAVTARIIAGFTNRASSTTMKSIGIVGRLASQPDSQAIVVASVSDPAASIRIPSTAEPDVRIEVALNITITNTESVTVTSSTAGSAMLSDLDRLVSCHKAGQPTVGERQGIYGVKDFRDDINVGDDTGVSIRFHGEERGSYGFGDIVVKNAENGHQATLTFHLDGPSRIEVDADFCPAANVVYNLGDPSLKWGTLYVDSIGSQTDFLSGIHTAALYIRDAIHLTAGNDEFLIYEDDGGICFVDKYTSGGSQGEFFFEKVVSGGGLERATINAGVLYGAPMDAFKAKENTSTHALTVDIGAIILAIPPSSFVTNTLRSRINVGEIITIAADTWRVAEWSPGNAGSPTAWESGSHYKESYWGADPDDYTYLPAGKYRACHSIASGSNSYTHAIGAPIMLQRVP